MKLRLPSGVFSSDIGIDLGTSNTLLFLRGQGVVVSEPSIVALDRVRHTVIAVGQPARAMLGRTPANIEVVRPLRNGVIADFEVAQTMLKELIARVQPRSRFFRPRIVIGVSSCTTRMSGFASRTISSSRRSLNWRYETFTVSTFSGAAPGTATASAPSGRGT